MVASDAITVGEDWISEHYLTSDAKGTFRAKVLERRKEWDATAKEGRETPRTRFLRVRQDLLRTFAGLAELTDADDGATAATATTAHSTTTAQPHEAPSEALRIALDALDATLLRALGYEAFGYEPHREGPVLRINSPGLTTGAPLAIISATTDPTGAKDPEYLLSRKGYTLRRPYVTEDGEEITSAARLLSHLFVAEDGPTFALVLAGPLALITEATRWAEGRYLVIDLQVVTERAEDARGGETDRALTCLAAQSLAPDAEGSIWWSSVLEESVKHTVGVSQDLRDGVRESIEIIANEVVARRRAQGLEPLPADQAQPLARQSLRFLYRILFLLYAEASPELGVLPTGEDAYERGYSLDRLRELTLVELADQADLSGTHLYDSLAVLFRLVDQGTADQGTADQGTADQGTAHQGTADQAVPEADTAEDDGAPHLPALIFRSLRADLFLPRATAHIDAVGLGNGALQQVLGRLLLSKESRGKERGFISYAELGINQLGAVYEGLMSYTGFFATEELYEVAKGGDGEKGSWVVPVTRAEGISPNDFVRRADPVTGERTPVVHERGAFVFRLSGRERQQSASYYTPEVLTRFTVSQALAELLDQPDEHGNEHVTTAREILDLTVCEPALGSGAFAIEAVRQLATEYLRRRQHETGRKIDPDAYPRELQKAKAYLALHQTYGVDLNETAVEFAEISLWLDTMSEGLAAPWFGLHLRRGNSLIGARHAFYGKHQLAKKAWLSAVPTDAPLTGGFGSGGRIHHFLLPAAGWGSATEAKEAKTLAPESHQRLKAWRRQITAVPTKQQTAKLVGLAHRVEALWDIAHRRLQIAEQQVRRDIGLWGAQDLPVGGEVTREQIEEALADPAGAFQRLRLVMDAWCALWFWPVVPDNDGRDDAAHPVQPPTLEEWLAGLTALLGVHVEAKGGTEFLYSSATWEELGHEEINDRTFTGALSTDDAVAQHAWLGEVQRIAGGQGFFHWELDFAPVFAGRGGFDLQVGNPPWVRPRSDVEALLAEGDPWWQLKTKATQEVVRAKREATLALPGMRPLVVNGTADVAVTAAYIGDVVNYPHLAGLQPDLYRCFMGQTWRHQSLTGRVGLIHPESHFTDEKAGSLRAASYGRLRRHWQFINELQLFEIDHHQSYGVHVYGGERTPRFIQASTLYHPDTAERSLAHDEPGYEEPGIKDPEGRWDLRPHKHRLLYVDESVLHTWRDLLETPAVPVTETRMVYAVNRATETVLGKLSSAPRVGALGLEFSRGWDESIDRKKGFFDSEWGEPGSWDTAILQGPHLHVANPAYKTPNSTMSSNLDWSAVDLEELAADAIPATSYKPRGDRARYDAAYTHWTREVVVGADGEPVDPVPAVDPRWIRSVETATHGDGTTVRTESISARGFYRLAWRKMAANTGERTLIPAILPPGATHIDGVFTLGSIAGAPSSLLDVAGFTSSLVLDAFLRAAPKANIRAATIESLPITLVARVSHALHLRVLRLNGVTEAYADLWDECYDPAFREDSWTGLPERTGWVDLGDVGPQWTPDTPLRRDEDRRQALLEIDALVALSLGLTADELCTIYRTQFPVLYGYDRNRDHYDANGRIVPHSVITTWRKRGRNEGRYSEEDLSAVHPGSGVEYLYELPFETLDREAHLRQAYEIFEQRLGR